jgi:hypothetical protein
VRKRSGRPPRFAAVPNETIDDAVSLDFMALGLLTVLLRHRDGWEITLAEIGEKYGYGRDAMAQAMGLLQVARYVVKIRIMSAAERRWSTEVIVYDTPASDEEIAELMESIEREADVRTVQMIQPTAAAAEKAAKRQEKLGPKPRTRKGHSFTVPPKGAAADGRAGRHRDSEEQADGADSKAPKQPRKTAASKSGTKASKAKAPGKRLSKEQAAAVRAVEEAFPEQLRELLPSYRPPVLRDAILQALDSRTADVIAERVRRRWWAHGYEADAMPGGKGIASSVGVAIGLVRPSTDCPEPMCEDGVILDHGTGCRACEERRADRKADRLHAVPAQRGKGQPEGGQAQARWTCVDCKTIGRGEGPEDGRCRTCRTEAEEAAAAARQLQEKFAHDEAERARRAAEQWETLLEEAHAEHAERERAAAEKRAEQEAAEQRRQQEEEETRRLREQIAREHPELAAFSRTS